MVENAIKNFPREDVGYYGFDFFSGSTSMQIRQKLEKTGCKFKLFKGNTVDASILRR